MAICEHCKERPIYRPRWASKEFPYLCSECYLYWWLPNQLSHLTKDAADFRKARGALHIDGLDAVEEIRKLRGG